MAYNRGVRRRDQEKPRAIVNGRSRAVTERLQGILNQDARPLAEEVSEVPMLSLKKLLAKFKLKASESRLTSGRQINLLHSRVANSCDFSLR
jgi:hypothetical protein